MRKLSKSGVYVLNTRSTTSGIRYAKAKVNNVNGIILLPDDWSSSYYLLNNTNNGDSNFTSNVISSSTWMNNLQPHGAVFMPAAGLRNGTSVYGVGSSGEYWSASHGESDCAWYVRFEDGFLDTNSGVNRISGNSVRLVCPAE